MQLINYTEIWRERERDRERERANPVSKYRRDAINKLH